MNAFIMDRCEISVFSIILVINMCAYTCAIGESFTVLNAVEKLKELPTTGMPSGESLRMKTHLNSLVYLNLMSTFPEELEVSDYCVELLHIFGQRYVEYVSCLVPSARPVKVCHNCFAGYGSLVDIYANISDTIGPGNVSCKDSLLRSDRLMLVYMLYSNLENIWIISGCSSCVSKDFQRLTNDTLYFMSVLNQSLSCFEKYQQGNHTELCTECKTVYTRLNVLYGGMEKNHTLCIDIEDGMNVTRRLWSKTFNCSVSRAETVPVIAVSSFMLFLPIIFYLSSFLHSEQKKRKLIHPNRAKSNNSLANIQDRFS